MPVMRPTLVVQMTPLLLIGLGSGAVALSVVSAFLIGQSDFGPRQVTLLLLGLLLVGWGLALVSPLTRPDSVEPVPASSVKRRITALGAVNLACFAAAATLSYGMTPLIPFGTSQEHNTAYFERLTRLTGVLGPQVQAFVNGDSALAQRGVFLLAYGMPMLVATGGFLAALLILSRYRQALTPDSPRLLFRWAVAFAVVSVLASPVLVHDFWYPIAWGRMVAAGANPYYLDLALPFTQDLPLNSGHERMMYGPLLAISAGALAWVAGDNVLLAGLLYKLLLAGAWIGSLWLIWQMLRPQPVWHQCVGILVFGWVPLNVVQAVAEGHSDILMVSGVLLWLYGVERGARVSSTLALGASVAFKYVSAPLLLLDVLHLRYTGKRGVASYLRQVGPAIVLWGMVFGSFYRSPQFFESLFSRTQWYFLSPREAVLSAFRLVGFFDLPSSISEAIRVGFALWALYIVARYLQRPERERFRQAVLAVMTAMVFGFITGSWPWYLVWVLGVAALVPGTALARWALGVALVAPFPILIWVLFPEISAVFIFEVPAVLMYAFALLWCILAPSHWFPGRSESVAVSRWPGWFGPRFFRPAGPVAEPLPTR